MTNNNPYVDLKNTSDDAIPNYLNSLKFKQIHTLTDTRLALGYSAFAIAAACFAWDYKLGFESTKYLTAGAVVLYMVLNAALTYWITFVEKGVVYEGVAPSGDKISIATSTKKNVPIYNVKVTITPKKGGKSHTLEFQRPFTEWFDSVGHFIAPPFQTIFASSVPIIATADPKRVAESQTTPSVPAATATGETDFVQLDQATLDALAAGTTGAETGSVSGKKSKRRKA